MEEDESAPKASINAAGDMPSCASAAEEVRLHDDLLFVQPISSCYGDCPICTLPLPLDVRKHGNIACCSKLICMGCFRANVIRERNEALQHTCPFCRHPTPVTLAEVHATLVERANEANDPVAMREIGQMHYAAGDYDKAFQYFTKSARQGDAVSHHNLSVMYRHGEGVEKDINKSIHHSIEAAIAGHPEARLHLGVYEAKEGSMERAWKHWIIAANLGLDEAVNMLKIGYMKGLLSKEDYAAVLREHKAAVDAMKSPQREIACISKLG